MSELCGSLLGYEMAAATDHIPEGVQWFNPPATPMEEAPVIAWHCHLLPVRVFLLVSPPRYRVVSTEADY